MRKEDLFRAVGEVRDEMILEAEPVKRNNTVRWKILSMAAAAVLVVGGAFFAIQMDLFSQKSGDAAAPEAYEMPADAEKAEAAAETAWEEDAFMPAPVAEEGDITVYTTTPVNAADDTAGDDEAVAETNSQDPAIARADGGIEKDADMAEVSFDNEADMEIITEETEAETEEVAEETGKADNSGSKDEPETEMESAEMYSVCSVNLAERELQKESTVQKLRDNLSAGIAPDPKMVSVPSLIQSLDYSKLLPQDADPHFCGELVLTKQGNGLLLIHVEADKDEYVTLYAEVPEDLVSGIRVYGDPGYVRPVGSVEILSEEISEGDTRTILLELELTENVNAGRMKAQLQLVTDDGEVYKVETCTLKAVTESKMSGAARLACAAGQTGVLLRDNGKNQESSYQRILLEMKDLPEKYGADVLKELISYLIKD